MVNVISPVPFMYNVVPTTFVAGVNVNEFDPEINATDAM